MSGGQHRDDEVNGPRSGAHETERNRNRESNQPSVLRRHTGVLRKSKKLRRNVLDGADFVRDVLNSFRTGSDNLKRWLRPRNSHFSVSVCQPGFVHFPLRKTKISVTRPEVTDRFPSSSVSYRYWL
jgi:hypothetical protein